MARDTQASAVFRYLKRVGAQIDSVTHNRHIKVKWTLNGRKATTVVGTSGAGEARKVKNMMAKLRRQVRELGGEDQP